MTLESPPMFEQATSGVSAEQLRRAAFGPIYQAGTKQWTDMNVSVDSGLTLYVSSGEAYVPGTGSTSYSSGGAPLTPVGSQGYYYVRNSANVTVTLPTANASNPRVDAVVLTVQDAEYAGSNNDVIVQVIEGTASSGATLSNLTGAPGYGGSNPIPASSLVLAYTLLAANGTSPSAIGYQSIAFATQNPPSVIDISSALIEHDVSSSGNSSTAYLGGSSGMPYPGLWLVETNIFVYNDGGGNCAGQVQLQQNGTTIIEWTCSWLSGQKDNVGSAMAVQCAVGDLINLYYNNTGSVTINFASGAPSNFNKFRATWLGPGQLASYAPGV